MKKIILAFSIFFVTLNLSACMSAKTAEELQLGKMTFNDGDYKTAFRRLLPLAAKGNPDAEYAIGYMYYYGYGVPQDMDTGMFWMKKAALEGNAPAIKAVNTIEANKTRG